MSTTIALLLQLALVCTVCTFNLYTRGLFNARSRANPQIITSNHSPSTPVVKPVQELPEVEIVPVLHKHPCQICDDKCTRSVCTFCGLGCVLLQSAHIKDNKTANACQLCENSCSLTRCLRCQLECWSRESSGNDEDLFTQMFNKVYTFFYSFYDKLESIIYEFASQY